MSRIGKYPVQIPDGVTVEMKDGTIKVKGPKGELEFTPHKRAQIAIEDGSVIITRKSEEKLDKSLHGTTRTIINNMVVGVSKGFEKKLEIHGVGYKAQTKGKSIILNLGFSHPIEYTPPEGIAIAIDQEEKNVIIVSGIDKQSVGATASKIRSYRKPEPYKGKGIRYVGEHIQRKAGKTAAAKA